MNIIEFLLPISYFRNKAKNAVLIQILHARLLHPDADVSIIAHSFGTFIISNILRDQFSIPFHRIIFCGSVVRYDFPFEQIQNRFHPPLLNEVGTRDPWPAVAESVTTGYGSAGTFGFRRPGVRDRYHNKAGHGYFLDADFCNRFWVPFLLDGIIEPGSVDPDQPAGWLMAIWIIRIKYWIASFFVLLVAWLLLNFYYGPEMYYYDINSGTSVYSYWNDTISAMTRDATIDCPAGGLLCYDRRVSQFISKRRYISIRKYDNDVKKIVSCGYFSYVGYDPVEALRELGGAFPGCIKIGSGEDDSDFHIEIVPTGQGGPTSVEKGGSTYFLCGCSQAQVAEFAK
ncbi:hypothetical protein [Mesorhizobium carmichaelinearum]|uniref:hypothetical protein n=1 Tax=Mesorhizobium carmichaelinearum TaxID=1208188 RepID=UPI00117D1AEC|nr:hypothetical protein [Mesorhizobium carmichaelinearum]